MEIIFIGLSIIITIYLVSACDRMTILYNTQIGPICDAIANDSNIDFEPMIPIMQRPDINIYYIPRPTIPKIYCESFRANLTTIYRAV